MCVCVCRYMCVCVFACLDGSGYIIRNAILIANVALLAGQDTIIKKNPKISKAKGLENHEEESFYLYHIA